MSNLELRVAMKKAGMSYSGRLNPITANTKPFKSLKVPWVYDANAFNAILLLGLTFALLPYGFAIEVVKNRQVNFLIKLRLAHLTERVKGPDQSLENVTVAGKATKNNRHCKPQQNHAPIFYHLKIGGGRICAKMAGGKFSVFPELCM